MLPSPLSFFDRVPDPRRDCKNKRYSLTEILFISLCAVLSGADTWEAVAAFGRTKKEWLQKFLPLPNGTPSHDTFGRVFSLIDSKAFEQLFAEWVSACEIGEHVALDGKTLRRSGGGLVKAAHMLHAWSSANGLSIAHVKVDQKSNEITAIPEVLSLLNIQGVCITIDAMGCQRESAKTIVSSGGDYILALKGNQGTLHEDVKLFLDDIATTSPQGHHAVIEKDHGRIETRRVWASDEIDWLEQKPEWSGLQSVIMVEGIREIGDKITSERRYYISSLKPDAVKMGKLIRAHWGIENSLHWVLDMAFDEDQSRVREGNAAENMAIIRRLVLNLIKLSTTKSKHGMKIQRAKAGWDDDCREKFIMCPKFT